MSGASSVIVMRGDARKLHIPSGYVQCVVTSPPYWGLRKYAGEQELVWGDWRGAFGLEPTVEMYVAHTVEILREVRRVLRADGVCFWNIGDSYAGSMKGISGDKAYAGPKQQTVRGSVGLPVQEWGNLKPKDLCLIPQRVALAAQADGWWVRSDIIWAKPNPMPESVRDRPTGAYEHILMLTKSARYYWDAEAVKEASSGLSGGPFSQKTHSGRRTQLTDGEEVGCPDDGGFRNLRNVWAFATQSYKGAHFATFPERLPELCIKAATSEKGCCAECGAPWVRMIEYKPNYTKREAAHVPNNCPTKVDSSGWKPPTVTDLGWRPGCGCGGIALDDLEVVETPTGEGRTADPTMETGRSGMNRPRGENEGTRPITRYEQRRYAEQLKLSPHKTEMNAEAGPAFSHYIRTDRSGARPVSDDLLRAWIGRGWLERVLPPDYGQWPATVPCLVLDPFGGSGTTAYVAAKLGRRAILVDLAYQNLQKERLRGGK